MDAVVNDVDVGPAAAGVRLSWAELPVPVRQWAEQALGARVVQAVTQPGGFSPGVAARLRCSDGTRAFLKAVSSLANPQSPNMHRREAEVTAAMPESAPVPRLLSTYDDGTWVALLFQDVEGSQPVLPWREEELDRVLRALAELAESLTPSPLPAIETAQDLLADVCDGWRRLAGGPVGALDALDPWSRRNLERLAQLESTWPATSAGETLLHCDLRADNLLLSADRVWVVDWPSACRGAAFVDVVTFAPSVAMQGGPGPEELMRRHPASRATDPAAASRATDPAALDAMVCATAGYFTHRAQQPPSPGLPTVRPFQAAQGAVARTWLARRTGWR